VGGAKRKVIYGNTRGEVAEKVKAMLASQQRGVVMTTADRLTVGEYLVKWVDGMRANVRASTWLRYSQLIKHHLVPHLGPIPVTRLAPAHLSGCYAAMMASRSASPTAGRA